MNKNKRINIKLFQQIETFDTLLSIYLGGSILGFIGCIVLIIAIDNNLDNGWFQPIWGDVSYFMRQYLMISVISFILFLIPWLQKKLWGIALITASLSTLISAYIWIPFVLLKLEDEKYTSIPDIVIIVMIISIILGLMEILLIWNKNYTRFTTTLLHSSSIIFIIMLILLGIIHIIARILIDFRLFLPFVSFLVVVYEILGLLLMPYLSLAFTKMATFFLSNIPVIYKNGGLAPMYILKGVKITPKSTVYKLYRIILYVFLFIASVFTNVVILDLGEDEFTVSLILLTVCALILFITTKQILKRKPGKKIHILTKIYLGFSYIFIGISILGRMMDDTKTINGFEDFMNNQNHQVQTLIIYILIFGSLFFFANIGNIIKKIKKGR
jgi:hypothetical protein